MEEVVDLAKEVRLSEASAERGVCDNILPQLSPMLNRISYQRLCLYCPQLSSKKGHVVCRTS